jgi:hypothetical protein
VLTPDRNKGRPPHLWLGMNRLVIDEISMVRVDVLDAIDVWADHLQGSRYILG